jgi:rhodanese-related sulfurtransferase
MERTIKPEDLKSKLAAMLVLDVRRQGDYDVSSEVVPGSVWKNPEDIGQWIGAVPKDCDVVIYCVRGGSVSNSVLDKLRAEGAQARYIEGGIEGWKSAGGAVAEK